MIATNVGRQAIVPEVRRIRRDEVPVVARSLARAFDADPIYRRLFEDDGARERRTARFFDAMLRALYLGHDEVYVTDDLAAAAVWAPPGKWQASPLRIVPRLPQLVSALRSGSILALRFLAAMEKHHLREPHWYLAILGADPAMQGRGYGNAVLRPALERCDREKMVAYLESSNEANLGFYRKVGFEMIEPVDVDGSRIFLMKRPPR